MHIPPQLLKDLEALHARKQRQEGYGKPIIAADFNGLKFVAIRGRLIAGKWLTFPDFLRAFVGSVVGVPWLQTELKKPEAEQHTIARLQRETELFLKSKRGSGVIHHSVLNGAANAFFRFAYHLYVVCHHTKLPDILLHRLKTGENSFAGVQHELYVAATFLLAGFDIEFEDESDNTTGHCEFTVTHATTRRKFSVEAKARTTETAKLAPNLNASLIKPAKHDKLVWIAIKTPATSLKEATKIFSKGVKEIRRLEKQTEGNPELKPAYVVISNHPFELDYQSTEHVASAIFQSFKLPDFVADHFDSLDDAILNKERHVELYHLAKSMKLHAHIPSSFDGTPPSLLVPGYLPRLCYGRMCHLTLPDGTFLEGILASACVDEAGICHCLLQTQVGVTLAHTPLSTDEHAAYKYDPDNFFGEYRPVAPKISDPVSLYEWFLSTYRNNSKGKLLELLGNSPELQQLSQEALAKLLCKKYTEKFTEMGLRKN